MSHTIAGTVVHSDGTPAARAGITITDTASGDQVANAFTDDSGRFVARAAAGEYAFAVTGERGFAWLENTTVGDDPIALELRAECHVVSGHVVGFAGGSVELDFGRHSFHTGDPAGKIGVLSYAIKPPLPFTVEGALMTATGFPDVAWFPLARLPGAWRTWLATTRYARELGAVYLGEDRAMILWDMLESFDGLAVIKQIHDSTPTPTGIRRARQ